MDKEKFMHFLSEAIDKGAKIDILFYGSGESREIAETRTKEFAEIVGAGEIEKATGNWYVAEAVHVARISHFYDIEETKTEVTA